MLGKLSAMLRSREGRDSLLTYAAEGISVIGMVYVYRLAARMGKEDLDLYIIVRRTVAFIYPLLLFGAVVGVTRFVALREEASAQRRYLLAALSWIVPLALLTVLASLLIPGPLAEWIFGTENAQALAAPVGTMIAGFTLYAIGYAFLRGKGSSMLANLVQVTALAAIPLCSFIAFSELTTICWATALGWSVLAVSVLLPSSIGKRNGDTRRERSELLRYGLPRVPGDLALGALLTVPVYVTAHTNGLAASGEVGLGTTLLNLAGAVFSPLALMLLPSSASSLASGDHEGLSDRIGLLTRMTLLVAAVMVLIFEVFTGPLLQLYIGDDHLAYVPLGRIIFLGALPFGLFMGMRSVLDAYYHTPRNGINLLTSLLLLVVGCMLLSLFPTGTMGMAVVLLFALSYLGWATWRDLRFVRSELDRVAAHGTGSLRLLVVIPAPAGSNSFPFAVRQAKALARDHGAQVEFFHLESRTSVLRLLQARGRFKRMLKTHRPDVVLAYYGSVSALFTVLSSSVPVVISFQGSDLNRTPADGFVRDLMGRVFSQIAAFFSAGIVCVSEGLRERLWWRAHEAVVLPLGADMDQFKPMDKEACRGELDMQKDGTLILFNANNPGVKRLDIALEVERLVQQAGLNARLWKLEGRIPFDRMPLIVNAADVLLLCSDSEGSPSMVKEAMVCGLPVVCNDVGDTRERLRDVTPGTVTSQDASALAEAIIAVLKDGRRSNGRELAKRNGCDAAEIDARLMAHLRTMPVHA